MPRPRKYGPKRAAAGIVGSFKSLVAPRVHRAALMGFVFAAGCIKPPKQPYDVPLVKVQDEQLVSLAELRGKPAIIEVWTTACTTCRVQMPALDRVYRRYRDQGLRVAAVSIDETPTYVVRIFADRFGVTFPVFHDRTQEFANALGGVYGVPQTFLVDRTGKIKRLIGPVDWTGADASVLVRELIAAEPKVFPAECARPQKCS